MKRRILYLFILLCIGNLNVSAITRRALIFGLGEQEDTRWGKIHGDNDVYYVEEMLHNAGYNDIKVLRNKQATKAAMVNAFVALAKRCRKGDVVYIHYSGHGQLMTDLDGDEAARWGTKRHAQWDESWIPYDAYMTYGKEDRGEKHLCDDELAELLARIRQRIGEMGRLIVAIDACHSGDATCGDDDECVRGVDTKFNIPRKVNTGKKPELAEEQWQTISACRPYQLSTEMKDLQIGKLTYTLYSLGGSMFEMENEELEKVLNEYLEMHKGRLPQNPVVSGKR